MQPRYKPAKFLGRGTKHNHKSMSARPPTDYPPSHDTTESAADPRPFQTRQTSAAETSLSKLLDHPAATTPTSPTTPEPCNCNLTRKISDIFRGSSAPAPNETAVAATDTALPADAVGKKKSIFPHSLFHSLPRTRDSKVAYEALAADPKHGVKSHRLGDGEREYTSFPAPRFDNKSSDRVHEFIERGGGSEV